MNKMEHRRQYEQWNNILSLGGITVTFNECYKPQDMMESVLGYCDDFYSVFEQFTEQEFQEQRTFFDEWYQVYSPRNESEPYFNVLIKGNTMRIEPF